MAACSLIICLVSTSIHIVAAAGSAIRLVPTSAYVARDSNYTNACANEFGSDAQVADWDLDIVTKSDAQMQATYSDYNIQPFGDRFLVLRAGSMVCNEGVCVGSGLIRKYFVERHDGNPPGNWDVFGQHAGLTLGSWHGGTMRVLCAVPITTTTTITTTTYNYDCTSLPVSMNGISHPRGCPGAVWSNGDPSQSYCEGRNGQYPWWAACCRWEGNSCSSQNEETTTIGSTTTTSTTTTLIALATTGATTRTSITTTSTTTLIITTTTVLAPTTTTMATTSVAMPTISTTTITTSTIATTTAPISTTVTTTPTTGTTKTITRTAATTTTTTPATAIVTTTTIFMTTNTLLASTASPMSTVATTAISTITTTMIATTSATITTNSPSTTTTATTPLQPITAGIAMISTATRTQTIATVTNTITTMPKTTMAAVVTTTALGTGASGEWTTHGTVVRAGEATHTPNVVGTSSSSAAITSTTITSTSASITPIALSSVNPSSGPTSQDEQWNLWVMSIILIVAIVVVLACSKMLCSSRSARGAKIQIRDECDIESGPQDPSAPSVVLGVVPDTVVPGILLGSKIGSMGVSPMRKHDTNSTLQVPSNIGSDSLSLESIGLGSKALASMGLGRNKGPCSTVLGSLGVDSERLGSVGLGSKVLASMGLGSRECKYAIGDNGVAEIADVALIETDLVGETMCLQSVCTMGTYFELVNTGGRNYF